MSGLPASSVILGTMTFGPSAQVKPEEATRILDAFVTDRARAPARPGRPETAGKAIVDTARVYQFGETEAALGAILAERPDLRARVEIHTKANPMISKLDEAGIEKQVHESLDALRVDKLDVFYLHSPDPLRVPLLDTLKACDKLYREGRFTELGLSAYAAWDVVYAHNLCAVHGLAVRPTIYQGIYNALSRGLDAELLPAVRTLGMRCVVYNPLGGGILTGRYRTEEDLAKQTSGRFSPEFDFVPPQMRDKIPLGGQAHKIYRARYANRALFEGLEIVRGAADADKTNMAHAAIRWALHHSNLRPDLGDGIIFGASSEAQARDNLAACAGGPLSAPVVDAYVKAWDVARVAGEGYFRGYDKVAGGSREYLNKF